MSRHAQLLEHLGHCRNDACTPTEVQGLEWRVLVLHDDPEDDVAGQSRRYMLSISDEIAGGFVFWPMDDEHGEGRGHAHELELPGHHDAEAAAPVSGSEL